jgi:hypothetical protein
MQHRYARPTIRSNRALSTLIVGLSVALLVGVLLTLAACGGSSGNAATTTSAGSAATTATTAAAAAGPDALGEQIGTVYVDALHSVATALEAKPDAATVRSQIEQLKNDTITKLVELGRAREVMSTSDKAKVDSKITSALSAAGSEDWYDTYSTVWKYYSETDLELANLIAAFNIIGQYANFDLLKQQAPEEATRLGIK